ncbi:hypothetical protein CSV67_00195 [Sporosarcina sp. P2]|nr:hypothetical protein CSV67_00195 [Sporosarcina sp. P2]
MLERNGELIHHDFPPRLEKINNAQRDFNTRVEAVKGKVTEIKSSQTNLELTVMKDGKETRGILNKFVNYYFSADKQPLQTERDVIRVDERITLESLSLREKIVLGIVGAPVGVDCLAGLSR